MVTVFIDQLKELVAQEDLLAVNNDVNDLRSRFEDYVLEEERKIQVAELEARDQGEEFTAPDGDFGKEEFYAVLSDYKERRKAVVDAKRSAEDANLKQKRQLIAKLREVITSEENIGAAFASFKEVQENWKEIGDIPRDKRSEVQAEYSKLIEDFFYNIKIYKELKDHDLHRNGQLKHDVVKQLKSLAKIESIKEVEQQLKALQNDWEDIGPVQNEEWEALKDAYWTEVRSIYERINRFYEDKRSEQQANIDAKKELISKASEIAAKIEGLSSVKDWESATEEILALQADWKKIGFGPRKENEEVWKEFRAQCDIFFDAKKAFFDVVHEQFDEISEKKIALIEKAESLKDSTSWSETSNALIQLQKDWKKLGHSGKKNEQKLWKRFRAACDTFFDARQVHYAEKDKAYEVNLEQKEALIEEIKVFKVSEDKKATLANLKDFAQRFNAIGMVPMKKKDVIYKSFKEALDTHYSALNLDREEKEGAMFQAKVETLKAAPDSRRQLGDLKNQLRKDIDRLNKEIILFENNLGFFSKSKGSDALRKDVEKKIEKARQEIAAIKTRLKQIPNE